MGKVFNGCKLSLRGQCEMSGNQRQRDCPGEATERCNDCLEGEDGEEVVGGNIKY